MITGTSLEKLFTHKSFNVRVFINDKLAFEVIQQFKITLPKKAVYLWIERDENLLSIAIYDKDDIMLGYPKIYLFIQGGWRRIA